MRVYEVGGSIRNELMGRPPKDRDFAVLADSYEHMKNMLLTKGAAIYQERPEFVAIRTNHPEIGPADFTLARKESFYTDSRHPDSVTPATTIEEDLARRDFTMNAIAREIGTTELVDPYNGQLAIRQGVIECVGDAEARFNEDRLRIFRAIRFSCQLGFTLSNKTFKTIELNFCPADFKSVSAERIQVELFKAAQGDWMKLLDYLHDFPYLKLVMKNKGVWLKPTLEGK